MSVRREWSYPTGPSSPTSPATTESDDSSAMQREWQYPPEPPLLRSSQSTGAVPSCGGLDKHFAKQKKRRKKRRATAGDEQSKSGGSLMTRLQTQLLDCMFEEEYEIHSLPPRVSANNTTALFQKTAGLFQGSLRLLDLEESDDDEAEQKVDDKFADPMSRLSYSQNDVQRIVDDDVAFRNMKDLLRHRGVITNSFLQQKVHLYVKHVREQER